MLIHSSRFIGEPWKNKKVTEFDASVMTLAAFHHGQLDQWLAAFNAVKHRIHNGAAKESSLCQKTPSDRRTKDLRSQRYLLNSNRFLLSTIAMGLQFNITLTIFRVYHSDLQLAMAGFHQTCCLGINSLKRRINRFQSLA